MIDKKREEEEKRAVNSYLYPAIICDDSENGSTPIFSEKFFSQEKRGQVVKIAIDSSERSQRVSTYRSRKWGIFAEISKLNRQITDS